MLLGRVSFAIGRSRLWCWVFFVAAEHPFSGWIPVSTVTEFHCGVPGYPDTPIRIGKRRRLVGYLF